LLHRGIKQSNIEAFNVGVWTGKAALAADLVGTGYRLEADAPSAKRPNPALRLIVETPAVNNHAQFDAQRSVIEAGINAAIKLRLWLLNSAPVLDNWRKQLA
jgi:hypothetical protein